jgi:hypothetical protein
MTFEDFLAGFTDDSAPGFSVAELKHAVRLTKLN